MACGIYAFEPEAIYIYCRNFTHAVKPLPCARKIAVVGDRTGVQVLPMSIPDIRFSSCA